MKKESTELLRPPKRYLRWQQLVFRIQCFGLPRNEKTCSASMFKETMEGELMEFAAKGEDISDDASITDSVEAFLNKSPPAKAIEGCKSLIERAHGQGANESLPSAPQVVQEALSFILNNAPAQGGNLAGVSEAIERGASIAPPRDTQALVLGAIDNLISQEGSEACWAVAICAVRGLARLTPRLISRRRPWNFVSASEELIAR